MVDRAGGPSLFYRPHLAAPVFF